MNPGHSSIAATVTRSTRTSGLSGEAIRQIVARISAAAGLKRVRPHGLRHAATTDALNAGKPHSRRPEVRQMVLGRHGPEVSRREGRYRR